MRLAHGLPGRDQRTGLASPRHQARTLTPAGRCVVRPVDALTTATAQVVPFACACDDVWFLTNSAGETILQSRPEPLVRVGPNRLQNTAFLAGTTRNTRMRAGAGTEDDDEGRSRLASDRDGPSHLTDDGSDERTDRGHRHRSRGRPQPHRRAPPAGDRSDEPLQKSRSARGYHRPPGTMVDLAEAMSSDSGTSARRPHRGAIAAAADQVAKWEAVNDRHAIAVARTRRQRRAHPAGHPAPAGRRGAPVPPSGSSRSAAGGTSSASTTECAASTGTPSPCYGARIGNRAMTHKKDRTAPRSVTPKRRRDHDDQQPRGAGTRRSGTASTGGSAHTCNATPRS